MLQQPPLWFILIAFVCAIGPLVFFHEFGHYIVGKLFGVGAETFSIGFGREIVGWSDRSGTRWKVGWLPLGGFVRFVGDENAASTPVAAEAVPEELRSRSFHHKPVWQRFLIVLAGPMANFLLAILIFAAFFAALGYPRTPAVVTSLAPQSAAQQAGLVPGDRILSIDGRRTDSFEDLASYVLLRPDERVTLEFQRDGQRRRVSTRLARHVETDRFGQRFEIGRLGVYAEGREYVRLSPLELLPTATSYTVRLTRSMIDGLWQIISGRRSVKDLGGPLKIAQIAGQQASLGAFEFIQLLAFFSINLGFINLLPVPMLDGGHLLFYSVEAVRRRPVSLQAQDWAFRGGLAFILALLLFTTVNDLDSFGLWDRLERLIG
ncbi:RIP metalloprotease RseP [Sphingomonas sp.]|uniref:RIP metalloprotease RseP n=1 Tax=Sphingomonas sp. TaxID=28214 RepID=UPI0017A1A797|nr:RIP metalloprotease RseP [Sphingomonas sp.]MBA3510839.1 RIP metalloprotease RseP [Sphingomonas sp.]